MSPSRQVPRVLGVQVSLGDAAYVIDGVPFFLAPAFHAKVVPFLGMLAMSELALAVWLLVKGARFPTAPARRALA
ncbi:MAG: DUF4386 family protein [Myxococcota bacterium]